MEFYLIILFFCFIILISNANVLCWFKVFCLDFITYSILKFYEHYVSSITNNIFFLGISKHFLEKYFLILFLLMIIPALFIDFSRLP